MGLFKDPVVAADGFTYEREAIVQWSKSPPAPDRLTPVQCQ